jgi:hypothetical protein
MRRPMIRLRRGRYMHLGKLPNPPATGDTIEGLLGEEPRKKRYARGQKITAHLDSIDVTRLAASTRRMPQ